ncbi:MAG TPA: hypothetical protein VLG27_01555 [Candidatus Saccharimonadia bacterium]|nr:hypothetical protein [Candidatus Saccharimonadia bacterium]
MGPNDAAQTNPQPQAAAPAAWLPFPSSWPGAFGLYKYSKQAVKVNLEGIVLFWLGAAILSGILDAALKRPGQGIGFFIGTLFQGILVYLQVNGVRQKKVETGEAFNKGLNVWLKMIGLYIVVTLTLVVSFLLLVVPFFFVAPRLVLASYFLVDKDMGVMDAFKASWDATKGHMGKVYGIVGASILMALLMVTIIGIPFAIYFLIMYSAAFAWLYEYVGKQAPQTASAPKTAPAQA